MEGIRIISKEDGLVSVGSPGALLELLVKHNDLEIMVQHCKVVSNMWISPADDPDSIEFFYLLKGRLTLHLPEGDAPLSPGESFTAGGLTEDLRISVQEEADILYVSNSPLFEGMLGYYENLNEQMLEIDKKDHCTLTHSRNVMRYTVRLYEALGCTAADVVYDDLVTAALFHDIGKCVVPDEILKKKGRLTPDEYAYIKRHAEGSAQILLSKYKENVANIARSHHERLDGSGYPDGLKGDEINFGSRLIAVADSFDAMTSERPYNIKKDKLTAARELRELEDQYDARITSALLELVVSGEADRMKDIGLIESE